jgi:hypothetical protein
MRGKLLALCVFIGVGYMGCKQEAYKVPLPAPANSMFPQINGSTWQYRDSLYGLPTDTFPLRGPHNDILTVTINSGTTDFNSLICYNAEVQSQVFATTTPAYYAVLQHKEYLLVSSPPWGLTTMQVLVDTAAVGYQWYSTPTMMGVLNGNPVIAYNTILEKNITRVVNGTTFTNVTHTSSNFQVNINNTGFHNIAYFNFYLAQGVGLIEKDVNYYGLLNETETLINYSIK